MNIIQARVAMQLEEVPDLDELRSARDALDTLLDDCDRHEDTRLGDQLTMETAGVTSEADLKAAQEYCEADTAIKVLQDENDLEAYGRVKRARKLAHRVVMRDLRQAIYDHPIVVKAREDKKRADEEKAAKTFEKEKERWRAHLKYLLPVDKRARVDDLIEMMEVFPRFDEEGELGDEIMIDHKGGHHRYRSFTFKMAGTPYRATREIVDRTNHYYAISPSAGPGKEVWDIFASGSDFRKYFDQMRFSF